MQGVALVGLGVSRWGLDRHKQGEVGMRAVPLLPQAAQMRGVALARKGGGGHEGRGLPVSEQARHAATLLTRCARSLASTTTARASPMPRLAVPRLSRATAVVVLRSSGRAWVADA